MGNEISARRFDAGMKRLDRLTHEFEPSVPSVERLGRRLISIARRAGQDLDKVKAKVTSKVELAKYNRMSANLALVLGIVGRATQRGSFAGKEPDDLVTAYNKAAEAFASMSPAQKKSAESFFGSARQIMVAIGAIKP